MKKKVLFFIIILIIVIILIFSVIGAFCRIYLDNLPMLKDSKITLETLYNTHLETKEKRTKIYSILKDGFKIETSVDSIEELTKLYPDSKILYTNNYCYIIENNNNNIYVFFNKNVYDSKTGTFYTNKKGIIKDVLDIIYYYNASTGKIVILKSTIKDDTFIVKYRGYNHDGAEDLEERCILHKDSQNHITISQTGIGPIKYNKSW